MRASLNREPVHRTLQRSPKATVSCVARRTLSRGSDHGQQNNVTSAVTSNGSGAGGSASASLLVIAPLAISKAFGDATVFLNATTTLTFNLSNPNASASVTGVGFSDAFPAGLVVANPNGLVGS